MENVIIALLSKAYKLDTEKVKELLASPETLESEVLKIDAERIAKIKSSYDNTFQNGYAKGKVESLTDLEQRLKEQHGFDSDLKGVELVSALLETKSVKSATTEDDVRRSKTFLEAEKVHKKQLADLKAESEAAVLGVKKQIEKANTFSVIKEKAEVLLNTKGAVMPKSPKVAQNLKNTFFDNLQKFDFEKAENGEFLVLQEGKILQDAHGHTRNLDSLISEMSEEFFEFQANNGGGNAANPTKAESGTGTKLVPTFKTEAEATAYANDESVSIKDRLLAIQAYNKSLTNT